jgi:hypothetical protein
MNTLREEIMSVLGADQLEQRHGYKKGSKKAIQLSIILAAVQKHMKEVIGWDETNRFDFDTITARNELRAEQREKAGL